LAVVSFSQMDAAPAAAAKAPGSNPQNSKNEKSTVRWEEYFPFVGCDNGTPTPNVELPDSNAPTPLCVGLKPPDVLPDKTLAATNPQETVDYEVGTIIVAAVSHEKVTIAADSRRVLVQTTADGTIARYSYNDGGC